MPSPANIAKHPIHPMLVVIPIGLWVFSLVCDVLYAMEWGGAVWNEMAFYTMAGGIIGALLAAVPGFVDFLPVSDPTARKIGAAHLLMNLVVVVLFAVNLSLRTKTLPGGTPPIALSAIAILLGISSWLGGEMVYVHGMAVEPQYLTRTEEREEAHVS